LLQHCPVLKIDITVDCNFRITDANRRKKEGGLEGRKPLDKERRDQGENLKKKRQDINMVRQCRITGFRALI